MDRGTPRLLHRGTVRLPMGNLAFDVEIWHRNTIAVMFVGGEMVKVFRRARLRCASVMVSDDGPVVFVRFPYQKRRAV